MDDHKKKRMIILAVSGVLFSGGVFGYFQYHENKNAAEAEENMPPVISVRRPVIKPTGAESTAITSAGGKGTILVQPAVPGSSTNPPIQTNKTAVISGQAVVVAPKPVLTEQPTTITNATPQRQVTKPVVVANKPPVVAPQSVAAVKLPPVVAAQPNAVAKQPPVIKPQPAAAVTPTVAGQQPAPAAVVNSTLPLTPSTNSKQYPATNPAEAKSTAKVAAGRIDPVEPITNYLPFPHLPIVQAGDAVLALVPPPPPVDKPMKPKTINEKLVPPPPPMEAMPNTGGSIAGLPIDQLPVPPSRPTIGDKVRVLGVLDDKAIIAFPKAMSAKNKWPKTVTLGTGEQFESLTIVSITRDGITIEEDGERTLKPLSTIK